MTFNARETSAADGRPIEIFKFQRGSLSWLYTSADRDQTVETELYKAAVIKRPKIEQGPEIARSVQQIVVPRTLAVLDQYRVVPPSEEVTLKIRKFHLGDTEVATIWQGVILGVKLNDEEATIQAEPRSNGMRRMGLRRIYQRQCPHVLYGRGCNLSNESFLVVGTVSSITGLSISVPEADVLPDGYFNGGYFEWLVAVGTYERRVISSHVGPALNLEVQTVGLSPGASVRMFPGCKHDIPDCKGKFNNLLNYGGMPYIPLKNPFGSDPVY